MELFLQFVDLIYDLCGDDAGEALVFLAIEEGDAECKAILGVVQDSDGLGGLALGFGDSVLRGNYGSFSSCLSLCGGGRARRPALAERVID